MDARPARQNPHDLPSRLSHSARQVVKRALRTLAAPELSQNEIHQLRLACKRLRALERLLPPPVQPWLRREVVAAIRTTAHALAPLRDDEVMAQLANALAARGRKPKEARAAHSFAAMLESHSPSRHRPRADQLARMQRSFTTAGRLFLLAANELSSAELERQLASSRERCAKELQRALSTESPKDLHRLRRRLKDRIYQLELLELEQPEAAATRRELANRLGERNDLWNLRRLALPRCSQLLGAKRVRRIEKLIARRERKLLRRIRRHGQETVELWLRDC